MIIGGDAGGCVEVEVDAIEMPRHCRLPVYGDAVTLRCMDSPSLVGRAHMLRSSLLAMMLLAGCSTAATRPGHPIAMLTPEDIGYVPSSEPVDGGPLVEAQLGPHRFRFPVNYYDDQMGPMFDGSWSLNLNWPSLEPFAAGERSGLRLEVSLRQVSISPSAVGNVDIDTLLERYITPDASDHDNPAQNLDLRIRGRDYFGLTPHYTNFQTLMAYYQQKYGADTRAAEPRSLLNDDWYIRYSAEGRIRTLIRCTSYEIEGTGVRVDGGVFRPDESELVADCRHHFVIPEAGVTVRMNYLRAFLHDWQRIEQRARQLLLDGHVDQVDTE